MIFPKEAIQVYLVPIVLVCVLVCLTSAAPTEHQQKLERHKRQDGTMDRDGAFLKGAYRADIETQLDELEKVEAMIAYQLQSLVAQRDQIQARKRGIHRQCFLNLVSCYKRR